MQKDAEPKWPRTRRWLSPKDDISPSIWALTTKLVSATAHDSEIASLVENKNVDHMMVDLMAGFRAARGSVDGILKGLTLEDGRAGGIVEGRPRRSLWAEITAHHDLRISVFRGHAPQEDRSLDVLAPLRRYSVDRHRILQIRLGGQLFDEIPPDGFFERTLINLHADIGELVVDLWNVLVARISAEHDLQEGDKPVLKKTESGRRLTMTTADEREAIAANAKLQRAAEEAARERVEIERAKEFLAGLTGDPVRAAGIIESVSRSSKRSKRQAIIRPALISCGLLSEGADAEDVQCNALAAKLAHAVRLARKR